MLPIPQIQIRQQYARIGIDADLGVLDIQQPRATWEMKSTPPEVNIKQPRGELIIDQSKAWDALGCGGILEAMSRIYSQAKSVAIQGIANIVERGNRLAAIQTGGNAIADIGMEEAYKFHEFDYYGEASRLNVKTQYIPRKPQIQVRDGRLDINTHTNPPIVNSHRGKLDIYMLQYPKVEIIPPQIDVKV